MKLKLLAKETTKGIENVTDNLNKVLLSIEAISDTRKCIRKNLSESTARNSVELIDNLLGVFNDDKIKQSFKDSFIKFDDEKEIFELLNRIISEGILKFESMNFKIKNKHIIPSPSNFANVVRTTTLLLDKLSESVNVDGLDIRYINKSKTAMISTLTMLVVEIGGR